VNPRRTFLQCALAATLAATVASAQAADPYPSKPIQLYVSFAPGGVGDLVARVVARQLTASMGQAVVIENRPVPVIGPTLVARSKPDGYTLAMTGNGTSLTQSLFKSLPYDLMKDFTHVSTLSSFDLALITNSDSPFNSVADVLAYARANPGKLNIGSARIGSTQNLSAELFKSMSGIKALIVPYKTTAEEITAIRSKDVQVIFEIVPAMLGQIRSKQVKVLAVTSSTRDPGLPSVPTIAESGLPGFEATSWNGISAPAKTPPEVVAKLNAELRKAVADPQVQKELLALGVVPGAGTPADMTRRMTGDIAKWGAVIDKAGIPKQ
jgi:tripartite-type tricarboxylate transporter receptor subunit TctC